jgi:hypothetical protein
MPAVAPCYWHGSLMLAGATSATVTAIGLLIGPLIISIIDLCPCRSIINTSRSSCCRGFDTDSLLLLCLSVVVGIIEDDDLAITRRLEDVTVEITKKLSGEFCIARSIKNE